MYLLSVTVYYDPPFYYNLAKRKPPSLLLSLSWSSPLMCLLRGSVGGSRWHLQRHPHTPHPPGHEPFDHGLKSLTPESSSENVNGSIQRQ